MPPALLGEILVRDGACSEAALRDALENQVIFGGRLGTNLLELNAVSEEALSHALAKQHGVPAMFGGMRLDRAAVALVKPELADRCEALPYLTAGRSLAVLVANPKDLAMLDEVAFATGKEVHPIVVPEARVWALLREAYGVDRHLRGIDVPFARLRRVEQAPRGPAAAKPPGEDLMDERAFAALYGRVGLTHAPPAGPADEVVDVELGDLLAPEPAPAAPPARPTPPPAAPPAEVLAALAASPGHAPPERLARPAAPPGEAREPSPLAFEEAVRFLEGVDDRNAIANTVLRYARSRFRRAVLFTVHRGVARGWAGLGEGLGPGSARRVQLPLDGPGIVETVVRTRAHFLGPIPKTDANIRLLKALGGGVPGNAFLVPILALGRVVNVFYADAGRGRVVDAGGVGELLILATRIAKSYDALLARVQARV